mgnify:CR=1 FL=1
MKGKGALKFRERREIPIAIKNEISKRLRKTYRNIKGSITEITQGMVRKQLMASNVTQSLLSGKLREDFGLTQTDANRSVQEIINYVSNNIKVILSPSTKTEQIAVFTLDLLPMGTAGLKTIPGGSYTSAGKLGGGAVTWLGWLLEKGTTVVIGDFWVFPDPEGITRAGSVMQKVSKSHPEGFRVDPAFAGTEQDNFVTKALQPIIPKIRDIVFQKIKEGLK